MPETRTLPTLYRDVVLDAAEVRALRDGDDRIPMSLSSEFAVERGGFFEDPYLEVLDHSPEAVDLARAVGGLPLLMDHDSTRQVGVLEDVHVGPDRKLRGMARFSRSATAQEIRQDVLDGIRTRTSIGYRVLEMTQDSRATKDTPATYRATKWALYENSLVSIPADPTVGAGRGADEAAQTVVIRSLESETAPQGQENTVSEITTAAPSGAAPVPTVSDRGAEIVNLCQLAGAMERAADLVNSDKSLADVRAELRAVVLSRGTTAPIAPPAPVVPDYADGKRTFSVANAVRAVASGDWSKAGYEREVSLAESKRLGKSMNANTVFVPTLQRLPEEEIARRAAHVAGTAGTGGNTVFTEFGGLIENLFNRSITGRLGATVMPGLQGNVAMPRKTADISSYWLAENSGSDATESNMTFDQVTLSPKTLMSLSKVSNQLLAQSAVNVDAILRNSIVRSAALELDRAVAHGSGASNQPTGLYAASNVNAVAFGGTVTYAKLVEMITAIAADNADYGQIAFAITPETMSKAMQVARFSSTDTPLYTGTTTDGQLIGYRAAVSNQLSKVLGVGTNEHGILCGVWPSVLIGEWGGMALTVDNLTLAGQDVVRIISRMFVDIDFDHPEAFAKGTGLIP